MNLFIHHHLGLGDMIHCNGMVRRLLKDNDYEQLYVFTKKCHEKSVQWMYRDEERIVPIPIDENKNEYEEVKKATIENVKEYNNEFLTIGHGSYKDKENNIGPMPCDMVFYDQINMPYSVRFDDCYWKRDEDEENRVFNKLVNSTEYIFMHDDASRGYTIDSDNISKNFQIIKNDMSELIFNLGKVIENAKEVHLMESSIRCMVEHLKEKIISNNVKMYLHNFRGGPFLNEQLNRWNGTNIKWEMVKYE